MKLEKLASVAEIASAVAVVVTLIILIVNIRENTEITRVAAYQSSIERFNSWREGVSSDYRKADLFRKFNAGEVPAEGTTERLILLMILNTLTNNYESAYFAYGNKLMGDEEWARIERSACEANRGIRNSTLELEVNFRLTEEYRTHLDKVC
jgi:hypothetical protein